VREAAETKVRTFVADASHELRTPLATIRAYAELSQRDLVGASDGLKRNVDRIESETVRMTSMVDDLLLLARLDSEPKAAFTDVDLTRIVAEAVMDAHAAAPDHAWNVDLSDEPVVVPGVESQLRQAVVNLVANARTHTPAGTSVTVSLRQAQDGSVVLQVIDDGPGIRSDLLPALFERFVRGDDSRFRGAGSTGLGLSIVHAVVEAHGGSVGVQSEPGHTVFRISLPPFSALT
jgi:two-component system, OmpR family, sensor kinase